jgi:hypothetical protein
LNSCHSSDLPRRKHFGCAKPDAEPADACSGPLSGDRPVHRLTARGIIFGVYGMAISGHLQFLLDFDAATRQTTSLGMRLSRSKIPRSSLPG